MKDEERRENRAAEEFMDVAINEAGERKRRFVNEREMLLDVVISIEKEYEEKFAKKVKKRILESRTSEELKLIMNGLMVLAGFAVSNRLQGQ